MPVWVAGLVLMGEGGFRSLARQTACLSDLRQLGQATFMYAQDNDDLFPSGGDPCDLRTNSWQTWHDGQYWSMIQHLQPLPDVMAPYVTNRERWHCPADGGDEVCGSFEDIPLSARPTAFAAFGMSYGYTTPLALDNQTIGGVRAWSRQPPYTEHEPAEIPLLTDMVGFWHGIPGDRHSERLNDIMVDCHAINVGRDQADQLDRIVFTIPTKPIP